MNAPATAVHSALTSPCIIESLEEASVQFHQAAVPITAEQDYKSQVSRVVLIVVLTKKKYTIITSVRECLEIYVIQSK